MDQAQWLYVRPNAGPVRRWPRPVVGPHDAGLEARRASANLSCLGTFLRRRRPRAFGQATLQEGPGANISRWIECNHAADRYEQWPASQLQCPVRTDMAQPRLFACIVLLERRLRNAERTDDSVCGTRRIRRG